MIQKIKKIPWTYLDIFFFIFIELLVFYLLIPFLGSFSIENETTKSLFITGLYLVQSAITLVILYFFTVYKYKISFKDFGFNKIPLLKSTGYVFMMWVTTILTLGLVSGVILYFYGTEIPGFIGQKEHLSIYGDNPIGRIGLIFSAFIIAPIVEEIVFRGFIMQGLMKYISPLSAILITSIVFSILHFEFLSIIPIFIIGSMLGWIYYKQKSLWGALMFHAINNGFALIVEFYS